MKVKAAPGVRVPQEGQPHRYITEEQAVDVPATPYYLLRLQEGDLVRADSVSAPQAPAAPQDKPAQA